MSKKNNLGLIIAILIAAILISASLAMLALSLNAENSGPSDDTAQQELQNGQQLEVSMQELTADNFYLGSKDAPITVVEYSDYACGWCQRFNLEVLPQIKKNFIDKGLVKFVYVAFPAKGESALVAAKTAFCAGKQNSHEGYFKMHDALFASSEYSLAASLKLAASHSLDSKEFENCFNAEETQAKLLANYKAAYELGVRGTPNFVINGLVVGGYLEYKDFAGILNNIIDAN